MFVVGDDCTFDLIFCVIADPNIDQSYRLYWSGYLALGYVWKVELCKTVARLSAEVKLQSLVTVATFLIEEMVVHE